MDSKKNTSKKAKYDIGIALGIFIISTLLGYFFNSYVTKDNISIENVELIPTYHSLEFNSELFSEIETLKENSFMLSGVGHNYPDELNENYRNLLSSQLKRDISKANAKISIIKKLKQSIEKGEIPIESQNLIRIYTLTPNQKITPQEILKRVDYHITSLTKLQQKETELLDEIQEFKKNRNGNCKISITFLNSGNTDGLIRPQAELLIDGYDETIALKVFEGKENTEFNPYLPSSHTSPATSTAIAKRSMVNITFGIDEDEVKKGIFDEFRQKLIEKQSFNYVVKITDFRNDEYKSGSYPHNLK